jgi:SAM-dependent methyltransferase
MTREQLKRYIRASIIDLRLFLTGKRERDLPPLRLQDVGVGDFRWVGELLLNLLKHAGELKPSDRVLDIGCGVGRVAIPLTGYLTTGTYDGFDIVRPWVRWCRRNITPKHPNFRFTHANVYNSHYNRRGVPADRYRFPYADASFDFAFATSVFTHLPLEDARQYLAEAHRVLRPGGTLLATFFLLDEDVKARMGVDTGMNFAVDRGLYRLRVADDPADAIAFDDEVLDELMPSWQWSSCTLTRGAWRGQGGDQFQDVIVATRA